jgi:isopenicillin-N epimerase
LGFAAHWILDPSVKYLNHGSYGACPRAVLDVQAALREELEREPVDFLAATLPARLGAARESLAAFLGASPEDLVFVSNATSGVNAVLRSLRFEPGDELLLTTHTYAACKKTIDFVASRTGLRPVVAELPFPLSNEEQVVAAVRACISPRTRLALMDHVTSPTALVLPIARLVRELEAAGIDTLVDGAHAPGMVPLALTELGAAYYTGNAHKWLCAPKGAAFLHVRRDRQAALHPNVISHGYSAGFHEEFDWTGTCDPTAWLCIPDSIRFLASLVPGGWPGIMAVNHALVLEARDLLLEACGIPAPCPDEMLGSMAALPLPAPARGSPAERLDFRGLHDWFRARSVETWVYPHPLPLIRISAQLYNTRDEFVQLARLLGEALHGG